MNKNNIIGKITACAESKGWNVGIDTEQEKDIVVFKFSRFTPCQGFSFSARMKDNSLESLVTDMEEYCEGIDVDSEVYCASFDRDSCRMKYILLDMEDVKISIENLLDAIRDIDEE